ncbi:MAG: thioredoxin family protein [Deltaproteobacteria bacterium]|nr:thioredoxin family protein [Deltaproteobacteria bacterium]
MEVKKITSINELDKAVGNHITLMDFGAPWCAPCRLQEPIIHRLAARFQGRVLIAATNVDESIDLASNLGIRNIPTLIIFKNGKELQRFVGLQSEAMLFGVLKGLLG